MRPARGGWLVLCLLLTGLAQLPNLSLSPALPTFMDYYDLDSLKAQPRVATSSESLLDYETRTSRTQPQTRRREGWPLLWVLGAHLLLCIVETALDCVFWRASFGDSGLAWGSRVALFHAANWPVVNGNGTTIDTKARPTLQLEDLFMRGATSGYSAFPHAHADVRNAQPGTVFIIDETRPTSALGTVYKVNGKALSISAPALFAYLREMLTQTKSDVVRKELLSSIAQLSGITFALFEHGWLFGGLLQAAVGVCIRRKYDVLDSSTGWAKWGQILLELTIRFVVVPAIVFIPGCPWWIVPMVVSVLQAAITFAWPIARRGVGAVRQSGLRVGRRGMRSTSFPH